LLLTYLTAVFDTTDHANILSTLSNTIGVKDRCVP